MMGFMSYANAYDDYNILTESYLTKDEVEYYKQNCKRNSFSYVCIGIAKKIEEKQ
jgi:hypothetical protein